MRENKQPSFDDFLRDVKDHTISIKKDEGFYRHLIFSNNGSFNQRFELVTWPNYLAFVGDMGSFVFSRIEDMTQFFGRDLKKIDTQYWAEKCQAEDTHSEGIREFDIDQFREEVISHTRMWLDLEEDDPIPEEIKEEIDHLLSAEDEYEAVAEYRNHSSKTIPLTDFWESSCKIKTYRFIWACYAIAWGLGLYDKETSVKG
jgi:hypothetical protein